MAWENGINPPGAIALFNIANVFNVSLDWLFGRTDERSDDGILFRDFACEVMELKRVEGIELSTLDRYQDILDNRLIPYFGHMKVRDISGSRLNRFYREMLQPGQNKKTGGSLSRKTVLEFHRLLSTIFTQAKNRSQSC